MNYAQEWPHFGRSSPLHSNTPFIIVDLVAKPGGICHRQLESDPLLFDHMTDGADLDSLGDGVGGRGAGGSADLGLEQGVDQSRFPQTALT